MCQAGQWYCIISSSLKHRYQRYVYLSLLNSLFIVSVYIGVVLGVVCHGGLLLTTDQLSAGQLMAFLVATQTIQRYQS